MSKAPVAKAWGVASDAGDLGADFGIDPDAKFRFGLSTAPTTLIGLIP